jgi:hypothetical protein
MIGIIGSADSVGLVWKVASEMGLAEGLIARSYARPDQAPQYARELDSVCGVILFTGRVPHDLATSSTSLAAATDYIPHSGADLYRTLVILTRQYGGRLPVSSIDTIASDVVRENYDDLGETPPRHVYAIDAILCGEAGFQDMVDFHRELYERGEVEVCITCLSHVREQLEPLGVRVFRVAHTRGVIRDSLQRAALTGQLRAITAAQIAVIAIGVTDSGDDAAPRTPPGTVDSLSDVVRGRLIAEGPGAHNIATTRGAVEGVLQRRRREVERMLADLDGTGAWIGVGFGTSLPHAEEQARYALGIATATKVHSVVMPDGSISRLDDGEQTGIQIRDTDRRRLAAARQAGIGSITFSRLQAALASLGTNQFTAKDFALAYGVETRSARRLLAGLVSAGLAQTSGAQSAPRAGRPQVIYELDVRALLASGVETG